MNNKKKLPLIVVNIIFGLLIMIFDYLFLSSYLAKAEKGVYVTYESNRNSSLTEVKKEIEDLKNHNVSYEELIKIINEVYGR